MEAFKLITLAEVLIPAISLIIVQVIISFKQQRLNDLRYEMTIAEIKRDIKRLEVKQDKHNSVLERFVIVEEAQKTQWIRIDEIKAALTKLQDKQ